MSGRPLGRRGHRFAALPAGPERRCRSTLPAISLSLFRARLAPRRGIGWLERPRHGRLARALRHTPRSPRCTGAPGRARCQDCKQIPGHGSRGKHPRPQPNGAPNKSATPFQAGSCISAAAADGKPAERSRRPMWSGAPQNKAAANEVKSNAVTMSLRITPSVGTKAERGLLPPL